MISAAIRAKTGLSQDRFARAFQISPYTLRNWEQGRRVPEGPARALLLAIDRNYGDTILGIMGTRNYGDTILNSKNMLELSMVSP